MNASETINYFHDFMFVWWEFVNNAWLYSIHRRDNPPGNQLLGRSFQKARRAFWGETRKGFSVHYCIYTNGHRSPGGLRDARKGIGVQWCLVS